ncbi:MAG: YtxH domain-containing protein [Rubrobacteraceae bacterium]
MIDKQRVSTFVLGGAVGALVGILLTPRTGRELRGSIADRAGEARDRGRESYFETQERLRERLAEMGEPAMRGPADTEEATIGPDAGPDARLDQEPPPETGPANPRLRGLRDVSRDVSGDASGDVSRDSAPREAADETPGAGQAPDAQSAGDRSEELRRKVQENRERLRRRTEGPGGEG